MPTKRKSTQVQVQVTKIDTREQRSRSRHLSTKFEPQEEFIRILNEEERKQFPAILSQKRQQQIQPPASLELDLDLSKTRKQTKINNVSSIRTIPAEQEIIAERELSFPRKVSFTKIEQNLTKKEGDVFIKKEEIFTKRVTRQTTKQQNQPKLIQEQQMATQSSKKRILNDHEQQDFQKRIIEIKLQKNIEEEPSNKILLDETERQDFKQKIAQNKQQKNDIKSKMEEEPDITSISTNIYNPIDCFKIINQDVKENIIIKLNTQNPSQKMSKIPLKIEPEIYHEDDDEILDDLSIGEPFIKYPQHKLIKYEEDVSTSVSKAIKPNKISQQYNSVLQQLNENTLPLEIPCRDSEKREIEIFLKDGLRAGGQSQAMYISGVPGIGKTASFLEVKNKLKRETKFHFVHVNGMNHNSPENLYCQLLSELTGINDVPRNQACLILSELFTKGKLPIKYKEFESEITRGNKIILLDECDFLVTPNQQLLYNLVDWPSYDKSKLIVVMIANTMDFPERLKPKLQSRLGNHRLVYRPYSSQQIEQIVAQRIQSSSAKSIFLSEALMFVSKKVATVSTDIRKTLSICRNSVEIAREEMACLKSKKLNKVTIEHVKAAYNKVYSQPYHACLMHLNEKSKLLLISIALEAQQKGYNVAYLSDVFPRFNQLLSNYCGSTSTYSQAQLAQMLSQLKSINMVDTKATQWIKHSKQVESSKIKQEEETIAQQKQFYNISDTSIQMSIGIDDLKNSLKDDVFFAKFSGLF